MRVEGESALSFPSRPTSTAPEKLRPAAEELKTPFLHFTLYVKNHHSLSSPGVIWIQRPSPSLASRTHTHTHSQARSNTHRYARTQAVTRNLCIYAISPQLVQRDVHITRCWRSAFLIIHSSISRVDAPLHPAFLNQSQTGNNLKRENTARSGTVSPPAAF